MDDQRENHFQGGNMKRIKILLLAALLLIPAWSFARTRVQASQIIDQINQGKAVSYSDAEIVGRLDLTSIKDTILDEGQTRRKWLFGGWSRTYWSHVRVPLAFSDCVFLDDVLAYVHDDDEEKTMNVVFHDAASFQGCEFQGEAHFKYAKFKGTSDFRKTTFRREALFKYTTFSGAVGFSAARFLGDANFKYVEFPAAAAFDDAVFKGEAIFKYAGFPRAAGFARCAFHGEASFKYAKFRESAAFTGAAFRDMADFKYASFSQAPDLAGCVFEDDRNFKYAKVRGDSFTSGLLKKR
jgi:hypothetical protein